MGKRGGADWVRELESIRARIAASEDEWVAESMRLPLTRALAIARGMSDPFAPGATLDSATSLDDYLEPPPPGRYSARLLYHDEVEIAESTDARAHMLVESPPFEVTVQARQVQLTRAVHEGFLRDIGEIDFTRSVLLLESHWSEFDRLEGEPPSPEDRLYRAGWQAMPALLEALADPAIELERADRVAALCFNISGILSPFGFLTCALPRAERIGVWPMVIREASARVAPRSNGGRSPGDAERRAYHDVWLSQRERFAVEFTD